MRFTAFVPRPPLPSRDRTAADGVPALFQMGVQRDFRGQQFGHGATQLGAQRASWNAWSVAPGMVATSVQVDRRDGIAVIIFPGSLPPWSSGPWRACPPRPAGRTGPWWKQAAWAAPIQFFRVAAEGRLRSAYSAMHHIVEHAALGRNKTLYRLSGRHSRRPMLFFMMSSLRGSRVHHASPSRFRSLRHTLWGMGLSGPAPRAR